jgi:hypothetical protein
LFKLLKNPWENIFFELISSAQRSVKIAVPFIKNNIVTKLYNFKNNNSNLTLITSFKLMNYYTGVSDLDAPSVNYR